MLGRRYLEYLQLHDNHHTHIYSRVHKGFNLMNFKVNLSQTHAHVQSLRCHVEEWIWLVTSRDSPGLPFDYCPLDWVMLNMTGSKQSLQHKHELHKYLVHEVWFSEPIESMYFCFQSKLWMQSFALRQILRRQCTIPIATTKKSQISLCTYYDNHTSSALNRSALCIYSTGFVGENFQKYLEIVVWFVVL